MTMSALGEENVTDLTHWVRRMRLAQLPVLGGLLGLAPTSLVPLQSANFVLSQLPCRVPHMPRFRTTSSYVSHTLLPNEFAV